VLALAPLVIFAVRNTPTWRVALCVWGVCAICVGASTGMMRFLLPVLPIALAAVVAGAAQLKLRGWLAAHYVVAASMCVFLLFGVGALLGYNRSALAAATGITAPADYLRDHSPEYEETQFINRTLQGREAEGPALVFQRHVYYLRIPFLYADPSASWAIDPRNFRTTQEWLRLFQEQKVRWVVRSPGYPPQIAGPLVALEGQGKLVPFARASVADFRGGRLAGDRHVYEVVILEVKN
jgi:hypothetical protein